MGLTIWAVFTYKYILNQMSIFGYISGVFLGLILVFFKVPWAERIFKKFEKVIEKKL